ncbi:fused MFS/spermidine synthase [Paenibacillus athensensis]|uniref:Spermidine synthase n=1 Tax=Paenibacillus athensensis TaxID=1967502 RepID=A0A4Y8Q157_9BACL|nr:fused MFS/spermidine synthase [Paenibacillus athensensis]MCD1260619.1 fused MFS/spermidine synthase [Paenibacillus athensensis]
MEQHIRHYNEASQITVCEASELYGEAGRFRLLQFADGAVQGAIDLRDPARIVFEYPRALIHLMAFNRPDFVSAFLIGHGIGTLPAYWAERRIKVAELSAEVDELSRRFFGYTGKQVLIGDGRRLLEAEPDRSFDYIVLDAFTAKGTPLHLLSEPFFRMTRNKLLPDGAILLNLAGSGENDRLLGAVASTLRESYASVQAFALPASAGRVRNILLAASARPLRYQARQLAGFAEITAGQGHLIQDGGLSW